MNAEVINPWTWQEQYGFVHGVAVPSGARTVYVAGQAAVDDQGAPTHAGDIVAQVGASLDNIEAVLRGAGMTLANVVRLNFYARDVDELFKQFSRVNERFGDSRYATTVLGVGQLPARFLVMLEATAVD